MRFKRIIVGMMGFLLLASCGKKQEAPQTDEKPYPAKVMEGQEAVLLSVYPVSVKGQEDIEIRPRIDGFIDAIFIDEGSEVKKGQLLFTINSPQSEQALISAKAALKAAQARVNTADTDVKRTQPLVEEGIVSAVRLKTVEDSYQTATAELEQARATLRNAKATLSWTNVTSPVNGFVGSIPFRRGSLVNSSNILTTVADTRVAYAYFSLNEKELRSFMNGLEGTTQADKIKNIPEVTLTLADGTEYPEKGRIGTITGILNVTTGSASFRAEFPNKHGELKSGTSGTISIPRRLSDAFVIPQKATFAQQDKTLVYVVQGDSVVQRIISFVSAPDGKNYIVSDGLKAGEKIVTDGIVTLSQGKKVRVH